MSVRYKVKLTANFERNLEEVESFLREAESAQAFDGLLDELTETIIPNLERFPAMGRSLLERPAGSVEVINAVARLEKHLDAITRDGEVREYVMPRYLLLYALIDGTVYLLSIRHQRQLSFDLSER